MLTALGISAFYHDSAAALVVGSELVAAAQQERFSRIKHDNLFPIDAIRSCLERAKLKLSDLDAVVFYEQPDLKLYRILDTIGRNHANRRRFLEQVLPEWLQDPHLIRRRLLDGLARIDAQFIPERLSFVPHHRSHAASAFYPSPYARAAILTLDGVGEFTTTSIHRGNGDELELVKEIDFPNSLGLVYAAFTAYLGFRVNDGEYKVMGLAPYGRPRYASLIREHLVDLHEDGSFTVNQSYFDYFTGQQMFNNRLTELLGQPAREPTTPLTQFHMDVAASMQAVTSEAVLGLAREAVQVTGCRDLCLAGGVALNCVANGILLRSGLVDRLWIQPAAGDAGGAVGAAFIGAVDGTSARPPRDRMQGSYLGPEFSDVDIEAALTSLGATYTRLDDDETLIAETVGHLTAGRVVGWFQGRMEFGPRALGNRSILADPRSPTMQRTLNDKTKGRESFRPFAPAVTSEACADWFDLREPSPYMLLVAEVGRQHRVAPAEPLAEGLAALDQTRSRIPAVTHVDYSARVQTVDHEANPLFHRLLSAFGAATGVPVLVNTSFNVSDEPIVCSPADAYRCFLGTQIDVLVMGRYVMERTRQHTRVPTVLTQRNWATFEADNLWCIQFYAEGVTHAPRNRFANQIFDVPVNNQGKSILYDSLFDWWNALSRASRDHCVIATFGGSTTMFSTNWPYYLPGALRALGEERPVVVVNLGQPGFSSFDNTFLLESFLEAASERGILPDVVISLDGANDLLFRIGCYIAVVRGRAPDTLVSEIGTPSNAMRELYLLRRAGQHRRSDHIRPSEASRRALLASDDAAKSRVSLPELVVEDIAYRFNLTVLAFRDACRNRGIACLNVLQPLLLEAWSDSVRRHHARNPDFAAFLADLRARGDARDEATLLDGFLRRESFCVHLGEFFLRGLDYAGGPIKGPFVVDLEPIVREIDKMWRASLCDPREHGALSLVDAFSHDAEHLFARDAIHYVLRGAEKIGTAVAECLMTHHRRALFRRWEAPLSRPELSGAHGSSGSRRDDVIATILDRCSRVAERSIAGRDAAAPMPQSSWHGHRGTDHQRTWAAVASLVYADASSLPGGPASFAWETDRGQLYPLY